MSGYLSATISVIIKPSVLKLLVNHLGMKRLCVDKEQTFELIKTTTIYLYNYFFTYKLKISWHHFTQIFKRYVDLVCGICKNCNNHNNRQSTWYRWSHFPHSGSTWRKSREGKNKTISKQTLSSRSRNITAHSCIFWTNPLLMDWVVWCFNRFCIFGLIPV